MSWYETHQRNVSPIHHKLFSFLVSVQSSHIVIITAFGLPDDVVDVMCFTAVSDIQLLYVVSCSVERSVVFLG